MPKKVSELVSKPEDDTDRVLQSKGSDDTPNNTGDTLPVEGMLQVYPDYGVLRVDRSEQVANGEQPRDVYISQSQIRRFSLRPGDLISGQARFPKDNERYLSLLRVDTIEGLAPEKLKNRPYFKNLTPIFPYELLVLETTQEVMSTRLIDLIAPIGKGQRGMIVSPPKAGKTWLLKDIANGLAINHPGVVLFVSLIGERPEEVTDMKRNVNGEIFASNFDEPAERHVQSAEFVLERAKRLSESGKDVVILLDSITRLARAYNMSVPPSGRTLSGGFDPVALYPPKRFFGAARCFEEGGSLTIIATALVDTGSRMDDLIYEEFKGTGNMELHLDRRLSERRIFPSIDILKSGTRHEEKLYSEAQMKNVWKLRRMVDALPEHEATELVVQRLAKTKNNKDFLENLHESS